MCIMTLSLPRILTLSPGGQEDPGVGVVVAGSRAGALGVLDFGIRSDAGAVREASERASRYLGGRGFGLRLRAGALGDALPDRWPAGLGVVVAVEEDSNDDWAGTLATLRRAAPGV